MNFINKTINRSSFGIAKTHFKITKKCLNGTLNADLTKPQGRAVEKLFERAGVRLHLTQLALRGFKGCFQYTGSIFYPLELAVKAVFSILAGIPMC